MTTFQSISLFAMDSKLTKFEHFINDFLREKLRRLYEERQGVTLQAAEYLQLQKAIQNLRQNFGENASSAKDLRMQVRSFSRSILREGGAFRRDFLWIA